MKEGILVVSFGTTYGETREKNIDAVEREIQDAYPQMAVYRAFSSAVVRRVLKERDGIFVKDIKEALSQMKEDGITQVYIQPTHVIDGIENHKVKGIQEAASSWFEGIVRGQVLLTEAWDYERVVETLWEELKAEANGKIVIFMGHGSCHKSNDAYQKLESAFHEAGHELVYVATVEAEPTIEDVLEKISRIEKKPVLLTPFMLVAGDHAVNDLAGAGDSYVSKLQESGYETQVLLKGLGEYPGIRRLYLEHLNRVIENKRRQNGDRI